MILAEAIFWISFLAIFHSYIAFPVLLSIVAKFRKQEYQRLSDADTLPLVHIFIAAHNEEEVIGRKLKSLLNSNYPADKMAIWVGSDCSTDSTNEIVRNMANSFHNLTLVEFKIRQGKTPTLNALFTKAGETVHFSGSKDEIIILTDANVIFERETVKELVACFKEESIGLVGATILNKATREDGISVQEKAYILRENKIKFLEGATWGTMMGAFGACYAIRANLFPGIPPNFLTEDFFISMHVLNQKYKAINNPKAICYEDVSNKMEEEFKRKIRISAGNFQNLGVYVSMLWPFYKPLGFSFLSHKVFRWFGPFFLIIMAAMLGIMASWNKTYMVMLIVMGFIFIVPLIDIILKRIHIHLKVLKFISYFMVMNLALLIGFFKYLGGIKTNVWQPTERNQ